MPDPLDYASPEEIVDNSATSRRWVMGLAVTALVIDGLAFGLATGDWVRVFPCLCLSAFVAPTLAVLACCIAGTVLVRKRGRDAVCWVGLVLAMVATLGAIYIFMRSVEAVASV